MDEILIKLRKALVDVVDSYEFRKTFAYEFATAYPLRVKFLYKLQSEFGCIPDYDDIDNEVLSKIVSCCLENYSQNTSATILRAVKSVMKNNKSTKHLDLNMLTISNTRRSTISYLTQDELDMFGSYFTERESDVFIKSVFMIMAYTGCNKDDAKKMNMSNYDEKKGTINYFNTRCNEDVCFSVTDKIVPFLKNKVEFVMSYTYFARRLKTLLYNSKAISEPSKGTLTLASCTFATLMYNHGIDIDDIALLMGIPERRSVIKYICGYVSPKNVRTDNVF